MATNDTKGWSELLDVVLFEAGRANLRQGMEHAANAQRSLHLADKRQK
jgi:hypothetical protein